MSFQVKFGSQSNVSEDRGAKRGGRRPQSESWDRAEPGEHHHHRGRGRGSDERGRGRGRRGYRKRRGGRGEGGDKDDEEDEGSDESDGSSSVTSEGPRGGCGGGGRRGRCGGGRGGKGATPVQPSEVHVYHHHESAPPPQHPPPFYPQQQPMPPQSGYQPYPNQPASGYSYTFPYHPDPTQPPYPPGSVQQPYGPAYPPQQSYPRQPRSSHPRQGPPPPARIPSLLGERPHYYSENQQPCYQEQAPRGMTVNSAGPDRGSRQNLNRKQDRDSGQSGRDDKPEQREDARRGGAQGRKQKSSQAEEKPGKGVDKDKQEKPQNSEPKRAVPELSPDEWIKVFILLLRKFNGRTKLGTLLSQKGDLFKGLSHEDVGQWLKHSNRFLTFEQNGQIKFVAINYKDARVCFKYRKHNTDSCENDKCPFFHICKDFIAGSCPWESNCHFNHSFHSKSNAKVCSEAGLQAFTDEDIRTIVFRSTPVVCSSFNKGGCREDCPDLHVCSKYLRNDCSDEDCKFGHKIKGLEHNNWILETFHMQKIAENTLCKMVIAPKPEGTEASGGKKPSEAPDDSATSGARDKKPQEKASGMKKSRSKEHLLDNPKLTIPTTPQQQEPEVNTAANKRQRKPKTKVAKEDRGAPDRDDYPSSIPRAAAAADVGEGLPFPRQDTADPERDGGPSERIQSQRRMAAAWEAVTGGSGGTEGGEGQRPSPASHYTHLCEYYTWNGTCSRGYMCPRYHHRHRPPFVWQLYVGGQWQDLSDMDNLDIEKRFCDLAQHEVFEVILDNLGGLKLSLDFNALTATVLDTYTSESVLSRDQTLRVRRWSTPSYVEADSEAPLSLYTQWCWYQTSQSGKFQPFLPGNLQYTLEEKYLKRQHRYYFEAGEDRFLLQLQDLRLLNLNLGHDSPVLRRPVFASPPDQGTAEPHMSALLLSEPPPALPFAVPPNWCSVDWHQDFEMVELDSAESDYLEVARSFHATVQQDAFTILRIFRVQNPALWDKYCSTKRAMTPRDRMLQEVDERKLFHGTPSLQAARGICASSMDFRRSGQNVGSLFGKGSYFSAHAVYSHNYTCGPDRYMFLANVLVGKFTLGKESYTSPPVREGLKLYDSCVDNEANPSIFVIFDLAQSYPGYLIQYKDAEVRSPGQAPWAARPTGSSLSRPGSRPSQGGSAVPPMPDAPQPSRKGSNPTRTQPQCLARAAAERRLPTEKKTDSDKCLIS